MKIASPYARRRPRIEIIPLIDIMFFLLATFVMVSLSMIKNQGIPVHLPVAASGMPQDTNAFATVTVTESGNIYLDHQLMDLEQLTSQLEARKHEDPELRVFLHGDERATFGQTIRVLDHVRRLGITTVAIQTRPNSTEKE